MNKKNIGIALAVGLCISIIAVCLFVLTRNDDNFIIETSDPAEFTETWEESDSASHETETDVSDYITNDNVSSENDDVDDVENAYPNVTVTDEENTVIDFTEPKEEKLDEVTPPEIPEEKTEVSDAHIPHEVNPDHTVVPSEDPKETQTGPTPGDVNEQGQVYDRAFGWITPSETTHQVVDGDGDPNKMVGSMQ